MHGSFRAGRWSWHACYRAGRRLLSNRLHPADTHCFPQRCGPLGVEQYGPECAVSDSIETNCGRRLDEQFNDEPGSHHRFSGAGACANVETFSALDCRLSARCDAYAGRGFVRCKRIDLAAQCVEFIEDGFGLYSAGKVDICREQQPPRTIRRTGHNYRVRLNSPLSAIHLLNHDFPCPYSAALARCRNRLLST